ncbi:MAG TPA: acyloxyacyl hydrolase [Rhodanobacter sp.]
MRFPPRSVRLALAISLVSLALPAAATHLEIQGGRSYMDSYGTNAVFVEGIFDEHVLGQSRFTWSPDVSAGWINGRDLARYSNSNYTTRDDVYLVAAGARFHYGESDNWYHHLFASIQPSLHSGRTQALSSAYEFVSTVGWQGEHFSLQLRHISNASLHEPNRGETMALVGVGFDL